MAIHIDEPQALLRQQPGHPDPGAAPRERLLAAHQEAAGFYAERLAAADGAGPRAYLRSRGLGPLLTATPWQLGYAPASWTALTDHLHGRGVTTDELLTAGLAVTTRTGGVVDRFRDRVMLPVRNHDGDLVGFVGRAAPHAGSAAPKYLNSPRTPVFDKSALLFGLSESHDAWAAGAVPVLVEGPFDVLATSLATQPQPGPGLAAVAPCGTALTATQAGLLARYPAQRVLVAFDADTAGRRASAKSYHLLAPHFSDLRAADLPGGCDPAALLQTHGPGAVREGLARTRPLADAVLDQGLRPWLAKRDNAEACAAAVDALAPTIAGLRPDDVARQVARLADAFSLEHDVVTEVLADAVTTDPRPRSTSRSRPGFSTGILPRQRAGPTPGLA